MIARQTHLRVLLVEDSPDDAFLLRRTLRDASPVSFETDWVEDLASGVERLEQARYDCLLLDLNLPDSFGLETLSKVRKLVPEQPILVLTGNADDEIALEAVRMGAQDYLVKGSHTSGLLVRALRYAVARKRQEEDLRNLAEDLRHSNETKNRLLSIIAHDIKNPLNGLLGFLDMAARRATRLSGAELAPMLENANISAQHLGELIENLLTWARSQGGRLEFRPQEIDIRLEIFDRVAEQYDSLVEQKELTLEVKVEAGLKAYADWFMVYTIVANLLGNAIKFSPKGGVVELKANLKDDRVFLRVADQGQGMDEETIDHVLKGDLVDSKKGTQGESGTGLGLLICRDFAERNGGSLCIESAPGEGSKIWVDLPFDSPQEAENHAR